MYCSEFNAAMKAILNIIRSETPMPADHRARVELMAADNA